MGRSRAAPAAAVGAYPVGGGSPNGLEAIETLLAATPDRQHAEAQLIRNLEAQLDHIRQAAEGLSQPFRLGPAARVLRGIMTDRDVATRWTQRFLGAGEDLEAAVQAADATAPPARARLLKAVFACVLSNAAPTEGWAARARATLCPYFVDAATLTWSSDGPLRPDGSGAGAPIAAATLFCAPGQILGGLTPRSKAELEWAAVKRFGGASVAPSAYRERLEAPDEGATYIARPVKDGVELVTFDVAVTDPREKCFRARVAQAVAQCRGPVVVRIDGDAEDNVMHYVGASGRVYSCRTTLV